MEAIILSGPTGIGKTALAHQIARVINGALISADSIQVYQGCDIISGKDIPPQTPFISKNYNLSSKFTTGFYKIDGVQLYLTDIIAPDYDFNVTDYIRIARTIYKEIKAEGKIPIFVGGTTLYATAITDGIETANIPPMKSIRKKFKNFDVETLQQKLKADNKNRYEKMNHSDKNNPRRLLRALEIEEFKKNNTVEKLEAVEKKSNLHLIGLTAKRETIKKRIDERVHERIRAGAQKEAEGLWKIYDKLSENIKNANGYRQYFEMFAGKMDEVKVLEKWKQAEYKHAKNQVTYFKKDHKINWVDIEEKNYPHTIIDSVKKKFNSKHA